MLRQQQEWLRDTPPRRELPARKSFSSIKPTEVAVPIHRGRNQTGQEQQGGFLICRATASPCALRTTVATSGQRMARLQARVCSSAVYSAISLIGGLLSRFVHFSQASAQCVPSALRFHHCTLWCEQRGTKGGTKSSWHLLPP